jgi:hypothetical protein
MNLGGDTFYLTGLRDHDGNHFQWHVDPPPSVAEKYSRQRLLVSHRLRRRHQGFAMDRIGLSSKEMGKMMANPTVR